MRILEKENISSNKKDKDKGIFIDNNPELQEQIIEKAIASDEFNNLSNFYDKLGIKDIDCIVFGEHVKFDIKEEIKRLLDRSLFLSYGEYDSFINKWNSTFVDMVKYRLREIYHLNFEKEHNIIISVSCNKLPLIKTFNTRNEKIIISDTEYNHSSIRFEFQIKTNSPDDFDPIQQIDIFCGIISVIKKEFKFYINSVNYDCGCQNSYLKDNVKFEDIDVKNVKLSDEDFTLIEQFYNNTDNFFQVHYAIEKYSWVNKRNSAIDKLLFIVFSFELLFGKEETNDSIQFKLMIRIINYLSKDVNIRQLIGKKIKDIYSARSKIVHGISEEKDKKIINKCIKNINNYQELLRQLIFKTIVNSNELTDHKKLLESIDYDIQNIQEVDLASIKWI